MVNKDGFRLNIGIIIMNEKGQVFWAKNTMKDVWQFPQGGIQKNENVDTALFRELYEETGLQVEHVEVLAYTSRWLHYRLPKKLIRYKNYPLCIGQKQKWALLKFLGNDEDINLSVTARPEFDQWCWTSYWYPLSQIVAFKKDVYRRALKELSTFWLCAQKKCDTKAS